MINYLEYDVIVIMRDDDDKIEEKRLLENMGMPIPEGDTEERKVKYSFTPSKLIGIRETFVKYQGNKLPGVIVELSVHPYETPVLLVEYKEFKGQLKEWNENNKKIT